MTVAARGFSLSFNYIGMSCTKLFFIKNLRQIIFTYVLKMMISLGSWWRWRRHSRREWRAVSCWFRAKILTEVFDDDLMRIFMPRSPGQLIPKTDRKRRPVFVCLFENFYRTKWMNVLFSLWWKMCWYKYILYIFVCIIFFEKLWFIPCKYLFVRK